MSERIRRAIERIKAKDFTEADVQMIAAAVTEGKLFFVEGSGAVGISGDISHSQLTTGDGNTTGDHNTVISVQGQKL